MNPALLRLAIATLTALIGLSVAWELWLAPLRPGGSWMVLKVLPLMLVLPGVLRGNNYAMQCSVLLIWIYVTEGLVRATSDHGLSATLGIIEAVLAIGYFICAIAILRPLKKQARALMKGDKA
jgi:uncharacterized membrane protein